MPRIGIPRDFPVTPTGWPNAYEQAARLMAEVLRGGGGAGGGPPRTMQPGPFSSGLPLAGPTSKTYGPSGQPFRTPPPQALRPVSNLPADWQGGANKLGGEYPAYRHLGTSLDLMPNDYLLGIPGGGLGDFGGFTFGGGAY